MCVCQPLALLVPLCAAEACGRVPVCVLQGAQLDRSESVRPFAQQSVCDCVMRFLCEAVAARS